MPFDSETFRPTADPLDLDAMIAWLETMPAEGEYSYGNCAGCAIAQFLRSHGHPHASVGSYTILLDGTLRTSRPMPSGWDDAVVFSPRTYGAALSRFRALREAK